MEHNKFSVEPLPVSVFDRSVKILIARSLRTELVLYSSIEKILVPRVFRLLLIHLAFRWPLCPDILKPISIALDGA